MTDSHAFNNTCIYGCTLVDDIIESLADVISAGFVPIEGRMSRRKEEKEIYCLCRRTYDPTEFMIECDVCKEWFHGR